MTTTTKTYRVKVGGEVWEVQATSKKLALLRAADFARIAYWDGIRARATRTLFPKTQR